MKIHLSNPVKILLLLASLLIAGEFINSQATSGYDLRLLLYQDIPATANGAIPIVKTYDPRKGPGVSIDNRVK